MKIIRIVLTTIIVALIGIGFILYISKGGEASESTIIVQDSELEVQGNNQQDIVNNLMASMLEQGVPIRSIQIMSDDRWNPPIIVAYVLQSPSEGGKASDSDPIYSMLAERAVNLAQRYGLKIGAIGETWVNSEGKVLSSVISAVVEKASISPQFDPPHALDDNTVAALIKYNLPLYGMSLDKIDTFLDTDNIRWATIELSVSNIEIANVSLPGFIGNTRAAIVKLNSTEKVQIAVYQIKLSTTQGKPLLTYVNDLQLESTIWWQADGLTMDWFPHPLPDNR
jgi:hypothetical protein